MADASDDVVFVVHGSALYAAPRAYAEGFIAHIIEEHANCAKLIKDFKFAAKENDTKILSEFCTQSSTSVSILEFNNMFCKPTDQNKYATVPVVCDNMLYHTKTPDALKSTGGTFIGFCFFAKVHKIAAGSSDDAAMKALTQQYMITNQQDIAARAAEHSKFVQDQSKLAENYLLQQLQTKSENIKLTKAAAQLTKLKEAVLQYTQKDKVFKISSKEDGEKLQALIASIGVNESSKDFYLAADGTFLADQQAAVGNMGGVVTATAPVVDTSWIQAEKDELAKIKTTITPLLPQLEKLKTHAPTNITAKFTGACDRIETKINKMTGKKEDNTTELDDIHAEFQKLAGDLHAIVPETTNYITYGILLLTHSWSIQSGLQDHLDTEIARKDATEYNTALVAVLKSLHGLITDKDFKANVAQLESTLNDTLLAFYSVVHTLQQDIASTINNTSAIKDALESWKQLPAINKAINDICTALNKVTTVSQLAITFDTTDPQKPVLMNFNKDDIIQQVAQLAHNANLQKQNQVVVTVAEQAANAKIEATKQRQKFEEDKQKHLKYLGRFKTAREITVLIFMNSEAATKTLFDEDAGSQRESIHAKTKSIIDHLAKQYDLVTFDPNNKFSYNAAVSNTTDTLKGAIKDDFDDLRDIWNRVLASDKAAAKCTITNANTDGFNWQVQPDIESIGNAFTRIANELNSKPTADDDDNIIAGGGKSESSSDEDNEDDQPGGGEESSSDEDNEDNQPGAGEGDDTNSAEVLSRLSNTAKTTMETLWLERAKYIKPKEQQREATRKYLTRVLNVSTFDELKTLCNSYCSGFNQYDLCSPYNYCKHLDDGIITYNLADIQSRLLHKNLERAVQAIRPYLLLMAERRKGDAQINSYVQTLHAMQANLDKWQTKGQESNTKVLRAFATLLGLMVAYLQNACTNYPKLDTAFEFDYNAGVLTCNMTVDNLSSILPAPAIGTAESATVDQIKQNIIYKIDDIIAQLREIYILERQPEDSKVHTQMQSIDAQKQLIADAADKAELQRLVQDIETVNVPQILSTIDVAMKKQLGGSIRSAVLNNPRYAKTYDPTSMVLQIDIPYYKKVVEQHNAQKIRKQNEKILGEDKEHIATADNIFIASMTTGYSDAILQLHQLCANVKMKASIARITLLREMLLSISQQRKTDFINLAAQINTPTDAVHSTVQDLLNAVNSAPLQQQAQVNSEQDIWDDINFDIDETDFFSELENTVEEFNALRHSDSAECVKRLIVLVQAIQNFKVGDNSTYSALTEAHKTWEDTLLFVDTFAMTTEASFHSWPGLKQFITVEMPQKFAELQQQLALNYQDAVTSKLHYDWKTIAFFDNHMPEGIEDKPKIKSDKDDSAKIMIMMATIQILQVCAAKLHLFDADFRNLIAEKANKISDFVMKRTRNENDKQIIRKVLDTVEENQSYDDGYSESARIVGILHHNMCATLLLRSSNYGACIRDYVEKAKTFLAEDDLAEALAKVMATESNLIFDEVATATKLLCEELSLNITSAETDALQWLDNKTDSIETEQYAKGLQLFMLAFPNNSNVALLEARWVFENVARSDKNRKAANHATDANWVTASIALEKLPVLDYKLKAMAKILQPTADNASAVQCKHVLDACYTHFTTQFTTEKQQATVAECIEGIASLLHTYDQITLKVCKTRQTYLEIENELRKWISIWPLAKRSQDSVNLFAQVITWYTREELVSEKQIELCKAILDNGDIANNALVSPETIQQLTAATARSVQKHFDVESTSDDAATPASDDYIEKIYMFDDMFDTYDWDPHSKAFQNSGTYITSYANAIAGNNASDAAESTLDFKTQTELFMAHLKSSNALHTIARKSNFFSADFLSSATLRQMQLDLSTIYRAYTMRRENSCEYSTTAKEDKDGTILLAQTNNEDNVNIDELEDTMLNCVLDSCNASTIDYEFVSIAKEQNACFLGIWKDGRLYHLKKVWNSAARITGKRGGSTVVTGAIPKGVWYDFMCAAVGIEHPAKLDSKLVADRSWVSRNEYFFNGTIYDCLIGKFASYTDEKDKFNLDTKGNFTFAGGNYDIDFSADSFNTYLKTIGFDNVQVTQTEIEASKMKCSNDKHAAIDELMLLCTLRYCKDKYPDCKFAFRACQTEQDNTEKIESKRATNALLTKEAIQVPTTTNHFGALPRLNLHKHSTALANCNVDGQIRYFDRYTSSEIASMLPELSRATHYTTRKTLLELPGVNDAAYITVMHSNSRQIFEAFLQVDKTDKDGDDYIIAQHIAGIAANLHITQSAVQRTLLLNFFDMLSKNAHWQDSIIEVLGSDAIFNRLFMSLPNKYYWADILQRLNDQTDNDPHNYGASYADLSKTVVTGGAITQEGYKESATNTVCLIALQSCNFNIELLPPWMLLKLSKITKLQTSNMLPQDQITFYAMLKKAQTAAIPLVGVDTVCNVCSKVLTHATEYTEFKVVNAKRGKFAGCLCKEHAENFETNFNKCKKTNAALKPEYFGGAVDMEIKENTRLDVIKTHTLPTLPDALNTTTQSDFTWDTSNTSTVIVEEDFGFLKVTSNSKESFPFCYLDITRAEYATLKKTQTPRCKLIYTNFDVLELCNAMKPYVSSIPALAAAQLLRLEQCAINYNFLTDLTQCVDKKLQEKTEELQSNVTEMSNSQQMIQSSIDYLELEKQRLIGHNRFAFPNVKVNDNTCKTRFYTFKLEKSFEEYDIEIRNNTLPRTVESLQVGKDVYFDKKSTNSFSADCGNEIASTIYEETEDSSPLWHETFKKSPLYQSYFLPVDESDDETMIAITNYFSGKWHEPQDVVLKATALKRKLTETSTVAPGFFVLSANKKHILVNNPVAAGHPLTDYAVKKILQHRDMVVQIGDNTLADPNDLPAHLALLNSNNRKDINIKVQPHYNEESIAERYKLLIDKVFDHKSENDHYAFAARRFVYWQHFHRHFNAKYFPAYTIAKNLQQNNVYEKYRYQSYIPTSWQNKILNSEIWLTLSKLIEKQHGAIQDWYSQSVGDPKYCIKEEHGSSANLVASSTAEVDAKRTATRAMHNYFVSQRASAQWVKVHADQSASLAMNDDNPCLGSQVLRNMFLQALKLAWRALCLSASIKHPEILGTWFLHMKTRTLKAYNVDIDGASLYYRQTEKLPKLDCTFDAHPMEIDKTWSNDMPGTYTKHIIDDIINFYNAVSGNSPFFYSLQATLQSTVLNGRTRPEVTCAYTVYQKATKLTIQFDAYTDAMNATADSKKLTETFTSAIASADNSKLFTDAANCLAQLLDTLNTGNENAQAPMSKLTCIQTSIEEMQPRVETTNVSDEMVYIFKQDNQSDIIALIKALKTQLSLSSSAKQNDPVKISSAPKKRAKLTLLKTAGQVSEPATTTMSEEWKSNILAEQDSAGNRMHDAIQEFYATKEDLFKELHRLDPSTAVTINSSADAIASALSVALHAASKAKTKPKRKRVAPVSVVETKSSSTVPSQIPRIVSTFVNAKLENAVFKDLNVIVESIERAYEDNQQPLGVTTEVIHKLDPDGKLFDKDATVVSISIEQIDALRAHMTSNIPYTELTAATINDFLAFLIGSNLFQSKEQPFDTAKNLLLHIYEQIHQQLGNDTSVVVVRERSDNPTFLPNVPVNFDDNIDVILTWKGLNVQPAFDYLQNPPSPKLKRSKLKRSKQKGAKRKKEEKKSKESKSALETKHATLVANRNTAQQLYDEALLAAANDSTKDAERDRLEAELREASRLLAAHNKKTGDLPRKKKKEETELEN